MIEALLVDATKNTVASEIDRYEFRPSRENNLSYPKVQ